jgi:hypothetical protein
MKCLVKGRQDPSRREERCELWHHALSTIRDNNLLSPTNRTVPYGDGLLGAVAQIPPQIAKTQRARRRNFPTEGFDGSPELAECPELGRTVAKVAKF